MRQVNKVKFDEVLEKSGLATLLAQDGLVGIEQKKLGKSTVTVAEKRTGDYIINIMIVNKMFVEHSYQIRVFKSTKLLEEYTVDLKLGRDKQGRAIALVRFTVKWNQRKRLVREFVVEGRNAVKYSNQIGTILTNLFTSIYNSRTRNRRKHIEAEELFVKLVSTILPPFKDLEFEV